MNTFKYIFFLLMILFQTSNSIAQFELKGKVIDADNEEHVVNAKVQIISEKLTAVTDENGSFNFDNIQGKNIIISVRRIGYKEYSIEKNLNDTGSNFVILKIEQMNILSGEIEVYSTKIENQLKYAIFPIALVPEKEFTDKPAISIPEAISTEPGINLVRDGIWASDVVVRGLGRDNLVVLVNGNRIETANNLSARLSLIDLNSIDRIEIIKGGTSAIYGSGGTGGVVSIYTQSGNFDKKFSLNGIVSGNFSSVNNLSSSGLSVFLNSKNIYANLYGTFRQASDTKITYGIIPNSSFRDNGISLNTGIKFGNQNYITLDLQRFNTPYAGIPGGYPLFPVSATVTYKSAERELYGITYEKNNMKGLITDLSAKLFLQNIFRETEVLPNNKVFIPASGNTPARRITNISIYPDGKHYSKGLIVQADFLTGRNNKLIGGIDSWQRKLITSRELTQKIETLDSNNNVVTTTIQVTGDVPVPESRYTSIGIFAQDEVSIMRDKIFVDVSGRVDGIYISNEESLNPLYVIKNGVINNNPPNQKVLWGALSENDISWSFNTGVNYKFTDKLNYSFNFSASFRSPSLEERYQYIDLGNVVRIGNPYLLPELGYFISTALKYWSEDLNLSLELFSNYLSELVTEIPGTYENRSALIKTNIGNARLAGFDAEWEYNFYRSFVFYGNASFVNGENTDDNSALPQIPPFNCRIGVKYNLFELLSLNFNSNIFSGQYRIAAGEIATPGYTVYNLYTDISNINIKYFNLSLSTGIENLSGLIYRSHLSTNRGSVTLEPGRNLFFKVKLVF